MSGYVIKRKVEKCIIDFVFSTIPEDALVGHLQAYDKVPEAQMCGMATWQIKLYGLIKRWYINDATFTIFQYIRFLLQSLKMNVTHFENKTDVYKIKHWQAQYAQSEAISLHYAESWKAVMRISMAASNNTIDFQKDRSYVFTNICQSNLHITVKFCIRTLSYRRWDTTQE